MKPLIAAIAAVAAILLIELLRRGSSAAHTGVTRPEQPDPDDDMAGVQVDVRPLAIGGPMPNEPAYWLRVDHCHPRTFSSSDEWPRPWVFSTQTGPLGPAA